MAAGTTVGGDLETAMTGDIGQLRSQEEVILVTIALSLITACAFVFNFGVIVVILKTPHLRGNLTYLFMLNLCIVDLLNSVTVLPIGVVSYVRNSWSLGRTACSAHGFLSAMFMYVSIFSACVISIERYYSIRAPMHYAAHMTLYIVLAVGGYLWFQAVLIAASPLLGWNAYTYRDELYICSYTSIPKDQSQQPFVIFVFTLCFLLPAVIIISMYTSIYQVAKHTSTQVHPFTSTLKADIESTLASTSISNPSVSGTSSSRSALEATPVPFRSHLPANHFRNNPSPMAGRGKIATIDDEDSIIGPTIPPVQIRLDEVSTPKPGSPSPPLDTVPGEEGHRRNLNSHWKAAKTLTCITLTFLFLWGPHFIFNLYIATGSGVNLRSVLAPIFLWLGYTSFAINPVIYGLLNRTIREALYSTFEQLRASVAGKTEEPPEIPGDEDFFQFLERTSTAPSVSPQPKAQRLANSRVVVEEAESGFESSAFP